ncbi:MAG: T9SS type A sorting domain-containing protein [Flavobacteriales bacterium]|nr:T9SS type A sorting domain-containing protein [Flavobacteriales bacterium]
MQLQRCLFAISFLGILPVIHAQVGSIRYFGDHAGVEFVGNTVMPLNDGELYSIESSTTMSGAVDGLLFYSNGGPLQTTAGKVWNRNHDVMPNGDMAFAGGCMSSNQGTIAVQRPGHPAQYYLFTTDCAEHFYAGGLRYSIVDMMLDGGLGDVTAKGIPVHDDVSESIALVRHANGTDVWLIAQELSGADLMAFLVDADSIHAPVHSTVFPSPPFVGGTLSANADGDRVCHADHQGGARLLAFDKAAGSLDTLLTIPGSYYGSAFSPNCRFLYLLEWALPRRIFQLDLNSADIVGSMQAVGVTTTAITPSLSIQIGPNGKLYMPVHGHAYLNSIEQPDQPGLACNMIDSAVYIGTGESRSGLPHFINDQFGPCSSVEQTGMIADEENNTAWFGPNPAHDRAQLTVGANELPARMRISDLAGKVLDDRAITDVITDIPLDRYAPGSYLIHFRGARALRSMKLVIE